MQQHTSMTLPKLSLPPGKELWEMAEVENWHELDSLLHSFDGFYVCDSAAESHLFVQVRAPFDECRSPGSPQRSFIASLLVLSGAHQQAYAAELIQRLLALGLHPDLQTIGGGARWRPSHYCSWNNRTEAAEILGVCRPDLGAKDIGGDTPRAIGEHGEDMWRQLEEEGFPIIARLACDKKWWAVRNLTRRRVVSEDEKFTPYKGKNAAQWAKYHGELQQAQELAYLLNSGPAAPPLRVACDLGPQFQCMSEKMASLQEKVDCDHESAMKVEAIVKEHQAKLLNMVCKGEADELKEEFALCQSRIAKEVANMRKDMEAVCDAAIANEQTKHQDDANNKAFQAEMKATLKEERESMRNEAKDMHARLEATSDANLVNLREAFARQLSGMTLMGSHPMSTPANSTARPVLISNAEMDFPSENSSASSAEPSSSSEEGRRSFLPEGISLTPQKATNFAQDLLDLVNKYNT